MKRTALIIVLLIITSIVGISGCTSHNNNHNQSHNPRTGSNNTLPTSNSVNYEANGYCYHVIDGDTIDVQGVGRIRFVGVNAPERGQPGYQEAKDFVTSLCLGKTVYLDIDDKKHYDKYGRVLAVVYAGNTNVNAELLKRGLAKVMYIPPSEFNPYLWQAN